jgi:hypothetical protein
MTNNEQEILYHKLMKILILLEDRNINKAKIDLESLIEFVKFSQIE